MDDATAKQLAAAIQALAATSAAPLATCPLPPTMAPPPTHVSPYEGDALDLSSQTGTSLFQNGCTALASKFTGKVEDLLLFLADIHNHVQTCHWNAMGMPFSPSLSAWTPSISSKIMASYLQISRNHPHCS